MMHEIIPCFTQCRLQRGRTRLEILRELEAMRDRECLTLWRIARRAERRGLLRLARDIRLEASALKATAPENLLNPFQRFRWAFGGKTVYEE